LIKESEPYDNSTAGRLKRKVASKKVAAEMALQKEKFTITSNKSQSSDVFQYQLKLAEDILNFNVALSASLANVEQVLSCFFLEIFKKN
jgi:hypothetical protein